MFASVVSYNCSETTWVPENMYDAQVGSIELIVAVIEPLRSLPTPVSEMEAGPLPVQSPGLERRVKFPEPLQVPSARAIPANERRAANKARAATRTTANRTLPGPVRG